MHDRFGWVCLLSIAAGCVDEPSATVIVCHNANCAHATDPFGDDTLDKLEDSLALTYRGHPAFDGIELDSMWDRQRSACIFAHDFAHVADPPMLATEAADHVATHLREAEEVSWNGERFFVKIELKNEVLAEGTGHTDEELAAHLDCALDMRDRIIAAARARGVELEFGFDSEVIPFLRAIAAHPRWLGKHPYPGVELRLISNVGAVGLEPTDLASIRAPGMGDGIDILSFHATRTPNAVAKEYADLGATLMLWMLDAAPETFGAAEAYEPPYIVTNEVVLFRRWEER